MKSCSFACAVLAGSVLAKTDWTTVPTLEGFGTDVANEVWAVLGGQEYFLIEKDDNGVSVSLAFYYADADDGTREMRGGIIVETSELADRSKLDWGFVFSNGEDGSGWYDGFSVSIADVHLTSSDAVQIDGTVVDDTEDETVDDQPVDDQPVDDTPVDDGVDDGVEDDGVDDDSVPPAARRLATWSYNFTWTSSDSWTEGYPDVLEYGTDAIKTDATSDNWTFVSGESYAICTDYQKGECQFVAAFSRPFKTGDAEDHEFGDAAFGYEVSGWYHITDAISNQDEMFILFGTAFGLSASFFAASAVAALTF